MKVLFLDHARTAISGAEFRLLDLVGTLPAYGVTPVVGCDPMSPLASRLRRLGAEQVSIIFPNIQSNRSPAQLIANVSGLAQAVATLVRMIRATGTEVVHVNTMLPRLAGLLAARLCGVPAIWHIRDFVVQPAWRRVYRAASSWVDRIVTVSNVCHSEFPGHPRIRTIYNGLDVKRYHADRDAARRELGFNDETVVIGLIGLLEAWKGHELLLEAATRPPLMTSSKVRFLIAGGESPKTAGQRQRLEERTRQLGIADRTRVLDFIDDVPRLLAGLDIVAAPSLRPDPLPGSVLEAMAAALPVVASRTGGIPEMIEDGRTGFLVEPRNADALAERLARLVSSSELRRRMGRAGRETVQSRFQLETSVRQLVDLYTEL